ncbi:GerMN domain-containing protein [Halonatronum saccharophilum]|uniref:GerMN domain-containing protein n=1 Tax=Halonatronum saccharophilum TaxID=150060 RepID=UPI0004895C0A|nr:GerMN domain-containing protein [Halonatronum saccharophilum]
MKKLLVLFLLFILLTSCAPPNREEGAGEPQREEYTLGDYYPFWEATLLSYSGEGSKYAEQEVYFDFIKGDRAQVRIFNPGTYIGKIIEIGEGEIRERVSIGEFYGLRDIRDMNGDGDIILKEPIEEGNSWTLEDGRKRYISGVDVEIETPFDNFRGIEVTTEAESSTVKDYYVGGVGHVRSLFVSEGGQEIEVFLDDIVEGRGVDYPIRFFYPNFHDGEIVYVDRGVEFRTNWDITELFEENLRDLPSDELSPMLGPNAEIRSISLDGGEGILEVDFTRSLVTEMNAGAQLEEMIIQSIVNTLGRHYGMYRVLITLEGKRYESGHIILEEGEYFEVDESGVRPFEN